MIIRNTGMLGILFFVAIALFAPAALAAKCNAQTAPTISISNLVVQRDAPVGSQIGPEVVGSNSTFYTCDSGIGSVNVSFGMKTYAQYVMTINNERVYSTNIPGVGYSLGMEVTAPCTSSTVYISESDNQNLICGKQWVFSSGSISAKPKLKFYKTAQTTGSGIVSSTQAGVSILKDVGLGSWYSELPINMNSFTVSTTACSVTNAAVKVPLGNILSTAFTGAGSTAAEKSFTIDLDCNASTRVNLTLEGAQDASGAAGVLALTQDATGTTASGVGVQVLYNSTPVTFGSLFNVTTTATAGTYSIPLKARYYQTAGKVTGGQANSLATFTLTYQ
ncbi:MULTISPECIES: fimbrial protein [Enterobacter]|uniref:fimbrial protein n=1 Tax=Enterobacter TaxID=547 RepID=UPI001F2FB71B|nr:fimbrial protein [Enterobacter quasiroggenkampii]